MIFKAWKSSKGQVLPSLVPAVDNEKMVLEVNKAMLESVGHRVYATGNSQEALAFYRGNQSEIEIRGN